MKVSPKKTSFIHIEEYLDDKRPMGVTQEPQEILAVTYNPYFAPSLGFDRIYERVGHHSIHIYSFLKG